VPAPTLDEPERYAYFLVDSSRRRPWRDIEVFEVRRKHFELDGNTKQTLNRAVRLLAYDTTRSDSGPSLRLYYGITDMGPQKSLMAGGLSIRRRTAGIATP